MMELPSNVTVLPLVPLEAALEPVLDGGETLHWLFTAADVETDYGRARPLCGVHPPGGEWITDVDWPLPVAEWCAVCARLLPDKLRMAVG